MQLTFPSVFISLREPESDRIIARTMYPEIPLRVDYRITGPGRSVFPVLCALNTWVKEYSDRPGLMNPPDSGDQAGGRSRV